MAYSGKYTPYRPEKYKGDPTKITFRSLWERQVFKWCDDNPHIVWWASEELVINYICSTDLKKHKYYPDLVIKYTSGLIVVIEIKPAKQMIKPVLTPKKRKSSFINESLTYMKNLSKWLAAQSYCEQHGYSFQVWNEHTLRDMGIKTLVSLRTKKKF